MYTNMYIVYVYTILHIHMYMYIVHRFGVCIQLKYSYLCLPVLVQSSDASLFMPHELDKLVQIMQAIGSVRELRDNNMKFRTFICLSMSRGLLCKWLQTLPGLRGLCCLYLTHYSCLCCLYLTHYSCLCCLYLTHCTIAVCTVCAVCT